MCSGGKQLQTKHEKVSCVGGLRVTLRAIHCFDTPNVTPKVGASWLSAQSGEKRRKVLILEPGSALSAVVVNQ